MSFWCGGQLIESSSDQVPWWDYGVGRPGWDDETNGDDDEQIFSRKDQMRKDVNDEEET